MSQAAVTNQIKARTFGQFWEVHGSAVVTALCLIFTILGWFSQKQGAATVGIVLFAIAYVIGGFDKAKEGLQTLFRSGIWMSTF